MGASVEGAATGRLVIMRTGIVLDRDTPALDRLLRLAKLGLGGRIGTGTQWISWIHVADFLSAVRFIRDHQGIAGVVHVKSPNPVQNRDMMATLRKVVLRPWSPPTPEAARPPRCAGHANRSRTRAHRAALRAETAGRFELRVPPPHIRLGDPRAAQRDRFMSRAAGDQRRRERRARRSMASLMSPATCSSNGGRPSSSQHGGFWRSSSGSSSSKAPRTAA